MIYLLHDDFFGEQRLADLRAGLGSTDVQSLNLTMLDGARLTVSELSAAVEAMPFLGDHRLVVVRKLFGISGGRSESNADGDAPESRRGRAEADREKEFLAYLPRVPATNVLVLYEDRSLRPGHPAVNAVRAAGGEVQLGGIPEGDQLERWIGQRLRLKGARIDRSALQDLAAFPIADFRQLDLTLDRLTVYADGQLITSADVRALVPQGREVTVFGLVDGVGLRDRRATLDAYRRLLADDVSPIYLLVMLTRQMRLILLAKEAIERHEDVAAALKVQPWVAQKLSQQARSFTIEWCINAFQRLAATDEAIKTGQADENVAVELLLVELTERRAS